MPDDLTPNALDGLDALHQAATPGPWEVSDCFVDADVNDPEATSNAALIAAMRTALPALIAAARERDKQFALAETSLGALMAAEDVLNAAAALDAEHAHDLDYRDEVVLGLRAERDALAEKVAVVEALLPVAWGNDVVGWALAERIRAALAAPSSVRSSTEGGPP